MTNMDPNQTPQPGMPPQGMPPQQPGVPPQGMPPQQPGVPPQAPPPGMPPQGQPANSQMPQFQMPTGEVNTNMTDMTGQFHPQDIQNNKLMAVLSYFGILVLIPLFAAKNSPFARFHANQGVILFIIEFIYGILQFILWLIILFTVGFDSWVYTIYNLITTVISLGLFVFAILGIVNAAQGKAKTLPLIGGFKVLK